MPKTFGFVCLFPGEESRRYAVLFHVPESEQKSDSCVTLPRCAVSTAMPISHEEAYCPYCDKVVVQRILIVTYLGNDEPSGWVSKHCFACGVTTVWRDGVMVYARLAQRDAA